MTRYEDLPLLPHVIAETVCSQVYDGSEISYNSQSQILAVEAKRQQMTSEEIAEFASLCDTRCRLAFTNRAEWFRKCVRSKSNRGRDQLYVWIRHWLAAFLTDPQAFRERVC